jgi:hypothetical protein
MNLLLLIGEKTLFFDYIRDKQEFVYYTLLDPESQMIKQTVFYWIVRSR